jgi:hypothetical protein
VIKIGKARIGAGDYFDVVPLSECDLLSVRRPRRKSRVRRNKLWDTVTTCGNEIDANGAAVRRSNDFAVG